MIDLKVIYDNLKQERNDAEARLIEYQRRLELIPEKKSSITIKKIHDELYYYAQHRNAGKVKSKYLGPVRPGSIAEYEQNQREIERLTEEIKELEWNIESIDKMLVCLDKRKRKQKILENFTFEVYWKDEITARVYVKDKDVIVSRYTDNPLKQLFADRKMTRYQLGKIFELRCWEKDRADINEILKNLGLKEYNPYEIVRKTHGVSYNDYIWFRFPGEKIMSKDVLVR